MTKLYWICSASTICTSYNNNDQIWVKVAYLQNQDKNTNWQITDNLPCTQALRGGSNVSHILMFLLSLECPAAAIRLDDPTNTKSLVVLLWHCKLWINKDINILSVTSYNFLFSTYILLFDCGGSQSSYQITFESVPSTNQYWAMGGNVSCSECSCINWL